MLGNMGAQTEHFKHDVADQAQQIIRDWQRPIILTMDITNAVGLIGVVQLALRHPVAAQSPTMQMSKQLVIDLIEKMDPEHGPLWKFLNLGFNPVFDE
jgi:hypothetical protein